MTTRRAFLERLSLGAAALTHSRVGDAGSPSRPAGIPRLSPGRAADEAYWERVKREFLFPARLVPLNAANMCPAPRSVVTAMDQATRQVDEDVSFQNRARFDELREHVRGRLARLLDAEADEIAIVRNTSEANNIVAGGLPLGPGDEVLLWAENHPTNHVAWSVRAARHGFSVRTFALDGALESTGAALDRVISALGPRTRVVAWSDVSNASGIRLPTAALAERARERGIWVHVDGAQTFGATPVSMPRLGCDSYSASTQKWLMGPREAGVLFLRRDRIDGVWPSVVGSGWGDSVEGPRGGARRFETMGQRNDATLAGVAAALDFVERLGMERIGARVEALSARLRAGLATLPGVSLRTPTAAGLSLGVVVARVTGREPAALFERLYREHGIIGAPTGGIRLCPHVYNTMADIDRTLDAVRAVLA